MPKTSKKKQKKAEDFKKVKLKVGKKKAPPSNATDTSFTAKSIVLADQSITTDKGNQLTNSRNLSLKDIFSQLRHYSAITRKEALAGMSDILSLHPQLIYSELGPIIEGTVRLIVDDEPVVRKSLLQLYGSFLHQVPVRDLMPFIQLLVVFICSAMSHILEDIRADAVKFLDLLVEVAPEAIAQFSSRILPNFYSLLETNTQTFDKKSVEIKSRTMLLTQGNRVVIMRSCYNYLKAYTQSQSDYNNPLWFMDKASYAVNRGWSAAAAGAANRHISCNPTDAGLYFFPDDPSPFTALDLFGESVRKIGSSGAKDSTQHGSDTPTGGSGTTGTSVMVQSREALVRLFPFLQATWMEASTMFGAGQVVADKSLELCVFVVRILQVLWRSAYADGVPPDEMGLIGFLRQSMVYFPFGDGYEGHAEVEEALLSLNIKLYELIALVQLGASKHNVTSPVLETEMSKWTKRAIKAMVQTLGMSIKGQSKIGSGTQAQQVAVSMHFRHEHFVVLLPVVWQMMCGTDKEDAELLLAAVIHYTNACPLASASKALCTRFLTKVIATQWSRSPVGLKMPDFSTQEARGLLAKWAAGLPKLLWQLRNQNIDASLAVSEALRLIHQRTELLDSTARAGLQAGLATLFCVNVPERGIVYGPFKQYPPDIQRTVLEIVSYSTVPSKTLLQAIQVCFAENPPADQIRVFAEEILGW
ncbi:rRNA processing protein [Coemansia sp. BCRC 34490]|nr:rRNA processing protein [Coemansia sp. BCRC 34490]